MDLYSFPYVGTVLDLDVIHACIILYLSDACMQILVHARSQVLTSLHAAACCPIYLRLLVLVLDDGFPVNGGTSSAGNDGER